MGEAEPAVDHHAGHLYAPVGTRVLATLKQADLETRGKWPGLAGWQMFEGYRSQARQAWLYAQGRTRPGAIVTNVRTAGNHGRGLAADIVWYDLKGRPRWDGDEAMWAVLGHCVRANGLRWGGDWKMHDTPHCEPSPVLMALWRVPAALWLRRQG